MKAQARDISFQTSPETGWRLESFSETLLREGGETVEYTGKVLSADRAGAVLKGEVKVGVLRPAMLRICVAVFAPACVVVRFEDSQVVGQNTSAESSGWSLQIFEPDVTGLKEPSETCKLEIQVLGAAGVLPKILLDDSAAGKRSCVLQPWSTEYFSRSLLFWVPAWGTLAAILLVSLTLPHVFSNPLFTFLWTIAAAAAAFFGFNAWTGLPFARWLRALSARAQGSPLVLMAMMLIFAGASTAAGRTFYGSWRRASYDALVDRYLETRDLSDLRRFIAYEPWRREGQLLFEYSALVARANPNRNSYVEFIGTLVGDAAIANSIGRAAKRPYYIGEDLIASGDPTVWYASFLPEARGVDGLASAVTLLSQRYNCASDLQGLAFEAELAYYRQGTDSAPTNSQKLREAIARCRSDARSGFQLQLSLDMLGQYEIRADRYREALAAFQEVLNYRALSPRSNAPLVWNRPPEKLVLYQFFRYQWIGPKGREGADPSDPVLTVAAAWLEYYTKFAMEFSQFYELEQNKSFHNRYGWLKGTVFDFKDQAAVNSYMAELRKKGWTF